MKRYLTLIVLVLSTIFYLVNNTDKIKIDFEEEIKKKNIAWEVKKFFRLLKLIKSDFSISSIF